MPIQFAYQVVKDALALMKMEEADPVDPGTDRTYKSWRRWKSSMTAVANPILGSVRANYSP